MENRKMNPLNRHVFIGDNWEVMLGLNADIADAIITDPPFNKEQMRKDDKMKVDKKKSKQLGFLADAHGQAIQHYKDNWEIGDLSKKEREFIKYKDKHLLRFCQIIGNQHSDGMEAYLLIMACRLLLCHEILKETGSIFLHCDHSSNAYLRMLMDAIFGRENFRNEIIWCYGKWSNTAKCFQRNTDTILFYAKNAELMKFNVLREFSDDKKKKIEKGYCTNTVRNAKSPTGRIRQLIVYDREKAAAAIKKGNYDNVVYVDGQGSPMRNWWHIPHLNSQSKERCRLGEQKWTDQKPLKLYTRLVKAVTKPGDLVMDPFCGCATTLIAAENCGCQWIGIDSHKDRVKLIRPQMEKLVTGDLTKWKEDFKIITRKKDFPKRTDDRPPPSKIDEFKAELLKRQTKYEGNCYYYYCEICEHPFRREHFEIDHLHPKSNRGEWKLENLQLLCSRCNRRKGSTKTNKEVRKELEAEGLLYHQRALVYHQLTGTSIRDSEAYCEEEANPKRATKVSRRKKESRQTKMGLG